MKSFFIIMFGILFSINEVVSTHFLAGIYQKSLKQKEIETNSLYNPYHSSENIVHYVDENNWNYKSFPLERLYRLNKFHLLFRK